MRILYFFTVLVFSLFYPGNAVFSQDVDNPRHDRVSRSSLLLPPTQGAPLSTVITVNNYDNFNLGKDNAENNMAEHPSVPVWYFTAYNNNDPHQTENGIDWHENNASFNAFIWGDPSVVYDSLGNLYYQSLFGTPTDIQGAMVIRSTDNGTSWSPANISVTGDDKDWITCDQTGGPFANYVYSTITSDSKGVFARSTDHGATFQTLFEPATQDLPGMMTCVGPFGNIQGGAVYVVTNSGDPFASVYTFYRSLDGGATFLLMSSQQFANYVGTNVQGRSSVEGMRTRPYPFIAADNSYGPHRGRLYLVYASNDPPGNGNKPDVFFRFSDDGGAGWSAARKVNDDPNPNQNNQYHPAIWCDKETGRFYVQWMDTRDVPTHDSAMIYATFSDDGGATFAPNKPVSNKKMKINCTTCGGTGTPRYQGDYNGIVSNRKVAMLGWTDFRNGTLMSTTAYFPDFAMKLSHSLDTLYVPGSTVHFKIYIPDVKLYSDTVLVSGSLLVSPSSGSISFSFPQGNMMTSFPDSLAVDLVLSGNVPVGIYHADFIASGPNGTPVHKREAVLKVVYPNTLTVLAIADPEIICQGTSSQLQAIVYSGKPPYSYSWSPSGSLNDPSLPNPVATPLASTWYHVFITDSTGNTAQDSIMVTVKSAPQAPGPVIGPDGVCKNDTASYSVPEIPGVLSYSWTVPGDAYIAGGQNTPHVTVHWGSISGNLSVIAGNACGNSNPTVLPVTLFDPPSVPGPIAGIDTVCKLENVSFSVIPQTGVTSYDWTVPSGVVITTGQGTETILVKWGYTAGQISVIAKNPCGSSDPSTKQVEVDSLPGAAGTISGKDTVCVNHGNYRYSIDSIPGANICHWTLPPGSEITSEPGRFSIILSFTQSAGSGLLSVFGSNECGDGPGSQKDIIVMPCTGVDNLAASPVFSVYPNPFHGSFNLAVNRSLSGLTLALSDPGGKILVRKDFGKVTEGMVLIVDLEGISEGIYILKLESPEAVSVQKIILE